MFVPSLIYKGRKYSIIVGQKIGKSSHSVFINTIKTQVFFYVFQILILTPNCAPTKKQVMKAIISIFMNARPVAWMMSASCVSRSAMMDMIWNILVMIDATVGVEE